MERYETAVAIGQGAYGEVFKAWDPEHRRHVALKLFPAPSSTSFGDGDERLRREAEAQRRLDHPSICQIYDVGTTAGGRGYIAMRYVDGESLDLVASRLPLEDRVDLVREIADAVACAHRSGLIHRDLKPANLLVEEQDDGALRPFVLDFGIVRMEDRTRLTETGQVLGTPGYLSPEQARGEGDLDARSDVFSLGVILYEMLTGAAPFIANSSVGALVRVLEHDPPLAHTVDAAVPPELGQIARKAMEKDPKRRYADAGALRRDLDRYRRADAVSARDIGALGRLVRRVERRPALWALGVALVAVALGALAWSVRERFVAAEQARRAEGFARRSSEIVARLRFLELLPEHPIGAGRARLDAEFVVLVRDVERSRGRARAAGAFAAGRGELAFGRPSRAIEHLAAARAGGYGDPSGALALAQAHLEKARVDLDQVDRLSDPRVRAAERDRLRSELRVRVLPLLNEAGAGVEPDRGDSGDRAMAEAMAALLLDRAEEAEEIASALVVDEPWRLEADALRADAARGRATEARNAERPDDALSALAQEQSVLASALERAPSSPALLARRCASRTAQALYEVSARRPEAQWEATFERAEAACETALRVLPSARRPASLLVEIGWSRALERLRRRGAAEVIDEVRRVVDVAEAHVRAAPRDASAHFNLGNARFALGDASRQLGQESRLEFERAAAALEAGLALAPGVAVEWRRLGHAWSRHGVVLTAAGDDPRPSFRRSIEAYTRGKRGSNLQRSRMENGVCVAQSESAYFALQHPDDAGPGEVDRALAASVAACRAALELDPEYLGALSNLALVHWTELEWAVARGVSPLAAAAESEARFRQLLDRDPDHVSGRNNFAGMVAVVASWRLENDEGDGDELLTTLREAKGFVGPLVEKIPADALLHVARLSTLEGAVLCRRNPGAQETVGAFVAADVALGQLAVFATGRKNVLVRRAELHRWLADCAHRRGSGPEALTHLESGRQAVAEALALDANSGEVIALQSRLLALAAAVSPSAASESHGSQR